MNNNNPLVTHNPLVAQAAPRDWRPIWHVGHLVYQGGVPRLKASSLTGGGFIPLASPPRGREALVWKPHWSPDASAVGSGFLPSRPLFTTSLLGPRTTSQF